MITGKTIYGSVRVTDTKSGTSAIVDVDGLVTRTQRQALDKAMRLLRSRIWAQQNGLKRPDDVIANYDLPEDEPFPNDLSVYRAEQ